MVQQGFATLKGLGRRFVQVQEHTETAHYTSPHFFARIAVLAGSSTLARPLSIGVRVENVTVVIPVVCNSMRQLLIQRVGRSLADVHDLLRKEVLEAVKHRNEEQARRLRLRNPVRSLVLPHARRRADRWRDSAVANCLARVSESAGLLERKDIVNGKSEAAWSDVVIRARASNTRRRSRNSTRTRGGKTQRNRVWFQSHHFRIVNVLAVWT
mmetsp:Transcript_1523/g.4194  ORF Transcript_1523/g.4194 Transcript_1523/m.4194 type:complete len:212 (-) Transcript_1523:137-772(-)